MKNISFSQYAKYLFGGFLFLLPLFYSFKTQQIFEVNKFFLLSIFTGTLLIFSPFIFSLKNIKIPISRKFLLFSSIFFLSIFLSSIFAQTPIIAFLGGTARHQGFIFLLMMFFLFLLIKEIFFIETKKKKKKKISCSIREVEKFLIIPLIVSTVIVSFVAISQFFGNFSGILKVFDFHTLQIEGVSMRSFGSLGQPNFLAQFLILPIFLVLYIFISLLYLPNSSLPLSHFRKFFLLILFFLFCFALYSTASRAGIVGVFSGIFFLSIFLLSEYFDTQKIFYIGSGLFFLTGIIGLFFVFSSPEILSIIGERSRSFLARIQFWKELFPLIIQNIKTFFFGIGGDNLGSIFQPIASVRLNELEGFSYLPDRAHTIWIDFPLHYGIIAFSIVIIFVGKIFWDTLKKIFHPETTKKQKLFLMSIFSGLLGTLISWSFGFYVTTDAVIFIIFLGIIANFSSPTYTTVKITNKYILYTIYLFLFITGIMLLSIGYITKNADIATFRLDTQDYSTEKEYNALCRSIELAPHLEDNIMKIIDAIDEKEQKKLLEEGKKYHFSSSSFYRELFIQEIIKNSSQNKKKLLQAFLQAKKSVGNSIDENIVLFKMAKQFKVLPPEKLYQYAREIFMMVPPKYSEPQNWTNPSIQKFWKHHQNFLVVLDYLEENEKNIKSNNEKKY